MSSCMQSYYLYCMKGISNAPFQESGVQVYKVGVEGWSYYNRDAQCELVV